MRVFVVTENDRILLEAWYKRNGVSENTDERIEFLKKRLDVGVVLGSNTAEQNVNRQ